MSRVNKTIPRSGFTLVEMLVIAPIALLVITGFIALMVTMVGDVIASRNRNVMTYDIQSALTTIERDVRLSTEFLASSGSLPTPQGKNGATAAFSSDDSDGAGPFVGDLILGSIATDKNPIDPTRSLVYYEDSPFACSSNTVYQNRLFFITIVYTVRNGSLWRRTYVPTATGNLCQNRWQVNTCAPGYTSAQTQCQATDSEILKNVKNFDISYYINPEDQTAIPATSAPSANSIGVSIEGEQTAAGRPITASSTARSTKLSSKEINLAPPASPVVTAAASEKEVTFTWPGVPTASSYIVTYNINGGGWITSSENTTATIFSVPAGRGDTVSAKVLARNTTGASADSSSNNASATIPIWTDCNLLNGWTNYGAPYPTCGYTITKAGVVMFKGLVTSSTRGSNSMIFRLPKELAPSHRLLFAMQSSVNNPVRLQVQELDSVYVIESTGTTGWLSLSGVTFLPSNTLYNWTALSFQNSWQNYSTVYGNPEIWAPLRTTQDNLGRYHINGLITPGTETFGTIISALPSGSAPTDTAIIPALSATTSGNTVYINSTGNLTSRGLASGAFLSVQGFYYPSSYSGWQNFTTVAGAPADGQIGNGWTAYSATPKYIKSSDGIVTVHNLIKGGTITNGTVFAKLPPGYRPAERHIVNVVTSAGVARVDVYPDGRLILQAGANATWTSLEGITFLAEL